MTSLVREMTRSGSRSATYRADTITPCSNGRAAHALRGADQTTMSRLWDSPETSPPYEWLLRPHVVDVRDASDPNAAFDIRSTVDGVSLSFAVGADTDLEVSFSRTAARHVAEALLEAADD